MYKYFLLLVVVLMMLSSPGPVTIVLAGACAWWCFGSRIREAMHREEQPAPQAARGNERSRLPVRNETQRAPAEAATADTGLSWDDVVAGKAMPISVGMADGSTQTMFMSSDPEEGKRQLAQLLGVPDADAAPQAAARPSTSSSTMRARASRTPASKSEAGGFGRRRG